MPNKEICILTIFVILSSLQISGVLSIYCFQCNSLHDPDCENIQVNDTNNIFYRQCQEHENAYGQELFCRKIVQTIYDRGGMVRVIRSCGWVQHKKECYVVSNKGHQEISCQCFHDGCNGANRNIFTTATAILSLILTLHYVRL